MSRKDQLKDWEEWTAFVERVNMDKTGIIERVVEKPYRPVERYTLADKNAYPYLPYPRPESKPVETIATISECECGAVKCKTTHVTWCPAFMK